MVASLLVEPHLALSVTARPPDKQRRQAEAAGSFCGCGVCATYLLQKANTWTPRRVDSRVVVGLLGLCARLSLFAAQVINAPPPPTLEDMLARRQQYLDRVTAATKRLREDSPRERSTWWHAGMVESGPTTSSCGRSSALLVAATCFMDTAC